MAVNGGGGTGRGVRPRVAIGLRGGAIRKSDGSIKRTPVSQTGYKTLEKPRGVLAKSPTRKMKATGSRARSATAKARPSVSPQNLVAGAHRAGANAVMNARIPRVGLAGQVGGALSGAGQALDRRFGPKSGGPRQPTSGGLKSYGRPSAGGSIGQAHQSFFDIGAFLKSLGR